ncbi:DUF5333 family protein [Celeribacter sp. SCSIO 80788]|jgi:hypothetical protein|uniref:DUF5333 family protein n=1 Tax=Celeribacter sp. SCSIO 80788 TaxID=3117013 RepID=UPI003DA6CAFE
MIRCLAYSTLIAFLAVPALAQMAITEDPDIRGPLVDNMIVTELTTICPKLAARPAQVNKQAQAMMETIVAKGYGADDIQTLQDPAFLAVLADESTSFFAAQGIEKRDTEAMCAFGKAQIAKRTPLGKLMKNR